MGLNERMHNRIQRRMVEAGLQQTELPYQGPTKPKPIVPEGPGRTKGTLLFLLCILLAPVLYLAGVLAGAPLLLR
jgi:hypothetical protein